MGVDFGDDPANSENEKPNMYKVERLNFCLKRERREFSCVEVAMRNSFVAFGILFKQLIY